MGEECMGRCGGGRSSLVRVVRIMLDPKEARTMVEGDS